MAKNEQAMIRKKNPPEFFDFHGPSPWEIFVVTILSGQVARNRAGRKRSVQAGAVFNAPGQADAPVLAVTRVFRQVLRVTHIRVGMAPDASGRPRSMVPGSKEAG